ncbi:ABC transporter permease [Microbacterium rhizophilus]|uniref:ABC transporter permease n=1 Tax=Microbacterium rhizophilus TaxID=3138934 RepID=UPI0031EF2C48
MKPRRQGLHLAVEVLAPVVVVLAILVFTNTTESFFLPPLQDVFTAFTRNWIFARVPSDLLPSLARLAVGYGAAAALGIVLGVLFGRSPAVRRQATPIVEFLRAVPPTALLPFTLVTFGIGDDAKIFLIALVCIWPILLNTIDGVTGIESTLQETGRSYGIPAVPRLLRIELPAAAPQIFAGLRASLPLAIIVMVISEMMGAINGIGFFIVQSQRSFAIADMWSGIVLLGILGYLLNLILSLLERWILAWHRGSRAVAR